MKNFFSALIWFFVLFLVAFFTQYLFGDKYCGICANGTSDTVNQPTKTIQKSSQHLAEFKITDVNGKVLFNFPSNFMIDAQDANIEIPASMQSFKDSVFNYLNRHQDQELLISAKYLKSEGEPRGLDRANFLKGILTKMGLNANRIVPKAVMSDYNYDDQGKYGDGIAMLFQNIPDEDMQAIEKSIVNKTLYAKFGSKEFKADASLQAYAFELKAYLEKYPDKNVLVTGHTDNVGKSSSNKKLGLARAKNVVTYLVQQGVSAKHIKADSKGDTDPVASNDTEEGRSKNRRITIKIN